MFIIDKQTNRIIELEKKQFSKLGFKEREHLQEWIANNPSSLGEELLIIQKEFSGFNDTNERLDLLALDKLGNLVIIENKLDDSGKDVTWQVIKYASYCASLTKQEIIKIYQAYLGTQSSAEDRISEFFGYKDIAEIPLNTGLNSQRLILVAANFRKEVTSSVLWLLNFKIRIQCFKITPFALNDQLFLNVEQILPTKDTEDFSISLASKAQEEIEVQETMLNSHKVRLKFWEQFLSFSNSKSNAYTNNSPSKENWLGRGIGMSGVGLLVVVSSNYCRVEITINRGDKEENKKIFDFLYNMKERIENEFGQPLTWERMDDMVTCRIKHEIGGVSYFDEDTWPKMNEFLHDYSFKMERAFREPVKKLSNYLKNK